MRHRTDSVSLTFGVLFVLVAVWWLISRTVHVGLFVVAWSTAAALLALGVLGLIAAVRGRGQDGG